MNASLSNEVKASLIDLIRGHNVTESLAAIERALDEQESLFAEAFAAEDLEQLEGRLSDVLQRVNACPDEHVYLVSLVLTRLIEMKSQLGYTLVLQSLYDLVIEQLDKALGSDSFAHAQVCFARASLESSQYGEDHYEEHFIAGLKLLPRTDQTYSLRLKQLAQFLAFRGRLMEIEASLPQPSLLQHDIDIDFDAPDDYLPLRFINAIEAGCLEDAQTMAPQLAEYVLQSPMDDLIAAYDSLLVLWQQRITAQPEDPVDPFSEDELNDTIRALFQRDRSEVFRLIEKSHYDEIATASTLFGYQSLRLSLALRDVDLAEELLDRRQRLGLTHWLDGFMQARCALLKGDVHAASNAFCVCMRQAERYSAIDRLDFELRLSMEMSPMQMVFLGHKLHEFPALAAAENPIVPPEQVGDDG